MAKIIIKVNCIGSHARKCTRGIGIMIINQFIKPIVTLLVMGIRFWAGVSGIRNFPEQGSLFAVVLGLYIPKVLKP